MLQIRTTYFIIFTTYLPRITYVPIMYVIRGAHFWPKFSSKSGFVILTLYSPPTSISILYLTSPTVTLTGGVKEGKLKRKRRTNNLNFPLPVFSLLSNKQIGTSLSSILRHFEDNDHTTLHLPFSLLLC